MIIPKNYRLLIVDEEGTVLDEIEIGEYDLDKTLARQDVVDKIEEALEKLE